MIGNKFISRRIQGRDVGIRFMTIYIMLFLLTGLLAVILISSSSSMHASASTNSSINKNETLIPTQVRNFILNQIVHKSKAAIVVGFVNPNGTNIFSFGNMSLDHNNIPVNQNTLFNIGSITKTFTTLLLADMVKQGLVNLNDPIEKFLPANVSVPQFNGHKITLEDLATHTSGLPEWPSNIWLNNTVGHFKPNYDANQLYHALSNFKLTREPGSKFQYSSFGVGLLGQILSLKTGIPYEELVKDRILNVLGMNDTKITLSENEIKNKLPIGHMGGREISTVVIPTVLEGSGSFRSTAADMLKYVSANLGLIHTKLDDAMQLTHLITHQAITANPMNYSEYVGMDWRIATNYGIEVISHSGTLPGWNAFVGFIPTRQIGVVALCNCDPEQDADMNNIGYISLHVAGLQALTAKTEQRYHTNTVPMPIHEK
jgi:serine-type D-Ala-D-Ala carboxypeptidase/endopeptidase